MQSLRSVCGVLQKVRYKNSDIKEWRSSKKAEVTRVERSMLRWFGHLENMNDSRLTKQIYRAYVCDGKIGKGRPRKSYTDRIASVLKKGPNFKHPKPTSLHEKIDGYQ
ncbi:hypothetical protein EVAR_49137_1 [Eumeta japonica]|uniref:Uncharacterized protein n=1 Tax=Eumeta variegata TaxID=151549 RepID=A0A4C1Z5M9_EUMVA|nr:hypothetical protein EVAR_49137_1 [Eumeta japonica]